MQHVYTCFTKIRLHLGKSVSPAPTTQIASNCCWPPPFPGSWLAWRHCPRRSPHRAKTDRCPQAWIVTNLIGFKWTSWMTLSFWGINLITIYLHTLQNKKSFPSAQTPIPRCAHPSEISQIGTTSRSHGPHGPDHLLVKMLGNLWPDNRCTDHQSKDNRIVYIIHYCIHVCCLLVSSIRYCILLFDVCYRRTDYR